MDSHFFIVPPAQNEPVYSYAPGTKERKELENAIDCINNAVIEIPMIIGGKEVKTNHQATT